jgi:hypothetical protein
MDRITTIESKIVDVLNRIDGTTQPSGYKFYSVTGTIQVDDEVLSLATNRTTIPKNVKSVNHTIEHREDIGVEVQEWSTGQKAYTSRIVFTIKSKVHNIGDEKNAKNAIRIKMNEVLSDLMKAVNDDYQLDKTVQWCRMLNSFREYEDVTNNRIQSATLISNWEVVYNQSFTNPDIPVCW